MVRSGIVEAIFLQSPSQNIEEESGLGSSLSHVLVCCLYKNSRQYDEIRVELPILSFICSRRFRGSDILF